MDNMWQIISNNGVCQDMKKLDTGLSSVQGFSFSAVQAGIRYENRLDFSLIYSSKPCNASGMFTTNRVFAAPVKICKERINNTIHGILINSTNANACTGEQGLNTAETLLSDAEKLTGSPAKSFLNASTGIIGRQLPLDKMKNALPLLIKELSDKNGEIVPRAIMTTDTKPKSSAFSFSTSKGEFAIAGTAKGSGMIAPNMATLLTFVITSAPVSKKDLDTIFRRVVEKTYNAITIDGDMSTNDTAVVLSQKSDAELSSEEDLSAFEEALNAVCRDLSYQLVRDAEGGTKCVTVKVHGAKSAHDAKLCAKAISQSLLVKTAFFGNDPNWGRIACAAGYSGADFNMDEINISIEGIDLLLAGQPISTDIKALEAIMKRPEYTIEVTIGKGEHSFTFLTSDISYDYVKINADYST
jgi:glutamate N-acetyltransferase / amino-acid N-acetyltransferase